MTAVKSVSPVQTFLLNFRYIHYCHLDVYCVFTSDLTYPALLLRSLLFTAVAPQKWPIFHQIYFFVLWHPFPNILPHSWMCPCEWAKTMSPFLDLVCKNSPLNPPPAQGNLRRHSFYWLSPCRLMEQSRHPTLCQLDLMWMSNKLLLGQATESSGYIFLVAGTHNCSVFSYILGLSFWHPFITGPIILTIFFLFSLFLILWHLWSYWLGRYCCPHHPGPANS